MTYTCATITYDGEKRIGERRCGLHHLNEKVATLHLATLRWLNQEDEERSGYRYVYQVKAITTEEGRT